MVPVEYWYLAELNKDQVLNAMFSRLIDLNWAIRFARYDITNSNLSSELKLFIKYTGRKFKVVMGSNSSI